MAFSKTCTSVHAIYMSLTWNRHSWLKFKGLTKKDGDAILHAINRHFTLGSVRKSAIFTHIALIRTTFLKIARFRAKKQHLTKSNFLYELFANVHYSLTINKNFANVNI